MPVNIKAILDELGASGEDRTLLEGFFAKQEPIAAKLNDWRENGLRQSDYSRRMDGLSAMETAKKASLEAEEQKLTQARDAMNAQFLTAQQDREKAEIAVGSMAAKVKRAAAEWNLPEAVVTDILNGVTPAGALPAAGTPPPASSPAGLDTSKFVAREDFEQLKQVAMRLPQLAVVMPGMRAQHEKLFGTVPPDFEQKLMDESLKQQRPLDVVWDNLYGVNQRKTEIHDAQIRQEERSKVEAEFKATHSASAVNPMAIRPDLLADSPVFKLAPLNPNARPQARGAAHAVESVGKAVDAFNSGKYKRPELAHQE